jgi:Domain of unknown function (DUF1937)
MLKVYLASPYTGYVGSRSEAYQLVCQKAAEIMMQNYHITVFCPIAHSHSIETESDMTPQEGNWWLDRDYPFLLDCDELWVYQMPGWEASYGVGKEVECATRNCIPIKYLPYTPKTHVGKFTTRT